VKRATGKGNKKEVAEGVVELSTIRTKREKITERNKLHNEYTRWCDNEVFIVCMPTY
jgi:hypothetical protein